MNEQPFPNYPPTDTVIPEGEDRERLVCRQCGHIFYENPKVIVGAVCVWDEQYLLCRRAIPPRKGFWTMPAGYLELSEGTDQGAIREVWEEAGARVEIDALLAIYNLPIISQVHLIYRARMLSPEHAAGIESQEVALFSWADIPWSDLAYPNVAWSLRHHRDLEGQVGFAPRGIPEDGWQGWDGWRAK
ncbi:NUDIX hydrolase [Telmatospirillum sp.]|uniref:NUDIX hydrolase n=1 Tax=Telmatospirillum sp. TaxID=2079197 RepID=UPI00283C505F|nr:NUDIX hydrolase [Telmatospirillum sp.]MDR3440039.1 NUDIX hydrolase [Telmatospirillum sp.]